VGDFFATVRLALAVATPGVVERFAGRSAAIAMDDNNTAIARTAAMATPASPDALLNSDLEQLAASQQGIASYDNGHLDALARPLCRRFRLRRWTA
jgi:hypothetical protein